MSSIYTPRPAYQDLGGSIVLHSIIKRFPTFLQCEALFFGAEGDVSQARAVSGPQEFREAVSTLPVNAILGPIAGGVPLTLYVSKPGFEEDFKEVAGDIAVSGCELVRAAPDAENPFFLVFGKPADLPAITAAPASAPAPVLAEPKPLATPETAPAPVPDQPSFTPSSMAAAVAVTTLVAPAAAELVAATPQEPAAASSPVVADLPVSPEVPVAADVPAVLAAQVEQASDLAPEASPLAEKVAEGEHAELRERLLAQAKVLAQTHALVQGMADDARQQAVQSHREIKQLLADQQAAQLAAVDAKLTQIQEQATNRQLAVARQAQDEQAERQITALRHLQQEQATQLQALLVKLQNEQSEWQQETFKTLERAQLAQQQAQTERPAWYAAGAKELGRTVAEQGETLQTALKAQQDQIIALQKTISEWRSQKSARVDEPTLQPEIGVAVTDLAWKMEKTTQAVKGISTRLGLLIGLNVLLLIALAVGFVLSTAFYGSTLAALRPAPAPTYTAPATQLPPLAVVPEPTVALTGVALTCADANLGRVYYDCTLANGVAYPQTLSLSVIADGGSANGFFPSVTLDDKQIFPDLSTTLATLGRFEVGQLKRFRLNVPCADARGCKPTTFVVRVVDSQASVVPGSEILITSASPAP